jgi:RNA polymerase sigma-70 factor, ECF subfamily
MTSIDGQLNWDRERGFVAPARPQSRERDPALATIAQLRAFSLLLCLDTKLANELVEITLLRVCVATDLSHLNPSHLGWLIGRLRTYFYADFSRRQAAIDPHLPLPGFSSQRHGDLLAAFASLTVEQREALILIEAAGLSYQAGARICRKPFLTFKKFVARARDELALSLASDAAGDIGVEELLLKVPSGFLLEA